MIIDVKKMSQKEKLQAMEILWDDLCRNVPDFQSPQWHNDILSERERNLKNGKDTFQDFEQVKKEFRDLTQ
ncbi:addiction module protein [candidate division CSSED10-310 bacterium]|uniref:Addiction module protein n=1 Tax=candidate division CSSED10-310 bacterium TaxID=2855610 RepID=A0ABV6Z4C5_UNCC1